jgi:hypothetical protein
VRTWVRVAVGLGWNAINVPRSGAWGVTLGVVSQRNTLETSPATTVLVVGGPPALVESARRAARSVPTAEVVACDLREAPTRVAELWPFVIIMSDDLYTFDSAEFDALARDVRARLITVAIGASGELPAETDIGDKILEAFRWRMS